MGLRHLIERLHDDASRAAPIRVRGVVVAGVAGGDDKPRIKRVAATR